MKRKEKGIAGAILAFVMIIAIAVGGAVAGWYAHAQNWFGIAAAEPKQEVSTTGSGGLIVGESEGNGITITAARTADVSTLSEDSYTLTATVSPIDATYKKVDWSIAWANGESAWASGKTVTDYVTITPTEDGALTATVACTQPFGEQITVTCSSRYDFDKKCSVTCDYAKRIDSLNISYWRKDNITGGLIDEHLTVDPAYSTGTIEGTIVYTDIDIYLSDEFKEKIKENYSSSATQPFQDKWLESSIIKSYSPIDLDFNISDKCPCHMFYADPTDFSASDNDEFDRAFGVAVNECEGVHAYLVMTYEVRYIDEVLFEGSDSLDVHFDKEYFTTSINSITVNNNHIVF